MPDPHISATPQAFSPTPWFERHGASLVAALFPGGDAPEDFAVKMLVHNHERMVMKVEFAGQRALLKAFNGGHSGAVLACYREIAVLANLDGTDLIPPLLAFSQSENWIMSGFVDGPELDDVITPDNAVDHARALGAWYARYTDLMDVQPPEISSDWLSYLNQYEAIKRVGLSDAQQDFLRGLPIKKRLIAKNDSFLGNFLVDQEGALMGVDFEKAELKPYGFDLLVTSRILVRGFPHLMVELTDALVEGWGRGTDAISRAQLLEVTRIFSLATAFTLEYEEDGLRRLRLRRYNTRAAVPASRVQEAPFMTDATEEQGPEARARLVTQLSQLADEQPGAHTLSGSGDGVIVATAGQGRVPAPPAMVEQQFCGTCKGSCCAPGAMNAAFIDLPLLERTRALLRLTSIEETIQHYAGMMPRQHVKGSCYFHGAGGCSIPRSQRSNTCNSYRCHALRSLLSMAQDNGGDTRVLVFAATQDGVQRARVLQGALSTEVDPAILEAE